MPRLAGIRKPMRAALRALEPPIHLAQKNPARIRRDRAKIAGRPAVAVPARGGRGGAHLFQCLLHALALQDAIISYESVQRWCLKFRRSFATGCADTAEAGGT